MKRGDVVVAALPGDLGKPRPAVIVQSDIFAATPTITLVPITSSVIDNNLFRLTVSPTPANGLHNLSQLMTDKITTVSRQKVGKIVGALDLATIQAMNAQLAMFIGIA